MFIQVLNAEQAGKKVTSILFRFLNVSSSKV